jgi:TPR repeat protein
MKWYRKAAEQGDAQKQFNLGFMYWLDGNNVEAANWYRKAAEQGHLLAQADLGDMYRDGKGIPQDYAEAAKWYRRAAGNDTAEGRGMTSTKAMSQNQLGTLYEKGLGVRRDYAEAAKWYRSAVRSGPGGGAAVFSMYFLCMAGKSTRQDCADAAEWLSNLANQDDSVLLPSVRALQGSNVSQYFLGTLYENGLGVPQDFVEAAKWYRKASDQGNSNAQFSLAEVFMYLVGASLKISSPTICGSIWPLHERPESLRRA